MRRTRRTTVFLIAVLVATPAPSALAQGAQQQGSASSARLDPTTTSAPAKEEFRAGLDDWQVGSWTTAEQHFRRAIALDSNFGLAHVFAGGIAPRSLEALRSGELDRGVALAAHASTAEGLLALAWREGIAGRLQRSAQILHTAMELLPDEPRLASEYVWALIVGSDQKSALDSVRVYLKRFPTFAPLYSPHAFLLMARGDSAEALKATEESARLSPQVAASVAGYGRALQIRGRYDEAEAQYRRALGLTSSRPDYPWDASSSLAELYAIQGRTAEARAIAMEGIGRSVDASDSALHLTVAAGTSILAGDQRQALSLLASAREKSQYTGGRAWYFPTDALLAEANALFGDRRAVPTYLARLPIISPSDSSGALAWHAAIYAYAGQLDSALAYADHLAAGATPQSQWRTAFAHLARGVAYAEKRQCAQAVGELRQSDSTNVEVQAARADCESQLGNRAAAIMWRDRVLVQRELRLLAPAEVYARVRMKRIK
jgi:tetratricopeptide (TPR) repeat protein